MSKKYKVAKGSISYKPDNAIFPIYIKVDEEIPENVLSVLKADGSLEKLIDNGTIVDIGVDLTEIRKGYVDLKDPTPVENVYKEINKQSKKNEKKTETTVEENKEADKKDDATTVEESSKDADATTIEEGSKDADGSVEEAGSEGKTEDADEEKDASKGKKK